MSEMAEFNRRLYPSMSDSDYYMLTRLRTVFEQAIDSHLRGSRIAIFDYGCGDIPYRELFQERDFHYVAGDLPENPLADLFLTQDGRVPVEDEKFDVVLSIQVLEHVPDVSLYLAEARRILKPGGKLFLSTHGWWTHHPYPHDYWRWTHEGLRKVVTDNGFEILSSNWMIGMLAYSFQLQVQCFKGLLEKRGRFAHILLRTVSFIYQQLMRLGDKIIPASIGQDNAAVYFLVVQKPR